MTSPQVTAITRRRFPQRPRVRQDRSNIQSAPVLAAFLSISASRSPKRPPRLLVLPFHGGEAIPHALKSVFQVRNSSSPRPQQWL